MVVSNSNEVTQEKISPGELKFLGQVAGIEPAPFHRYEGKIEGAEKALTKWLRPPSGRWSVGGKKIFRRIVSFVAEHNADDNGFIRLAVYAGKFPHLKLEGISIPPTVGLVFDIPNQIVRHGWMHGKDKFAGGELDISFGVQVVCQYLPQPVYEDWVGMGAPPEVVTSITDNQSERIKRDELALLSKAAPLQAVPA
jgi:hypothetical protein